MLIQELSVGSLFQVRFSAYEYMLWVLYLMWAESQNLRGVRDMMEITFGHSLTATYLQEPLFQNQTGIHYFMI